VCTCLCTTEARGRNTDVEAISNFGTVSPAANRSEGISYVGTSKMHLSQGNACADDGGDCWHTTAADSFCARLLYIIHVAKA
jgi:hypothetical protein